MKTREGEDSTEFQARVWPQSITVDSYEWLADWPGLVGHTPQVNFESPVEETTRILKATWFADPDSRWQTYTGDPENPVPTFNWADYDLAVEVTVNGKKCMCRPRRWTVEADMTGRVEPWPIWGGLSVVPSIQVEQDPLDNLWYVTGQGQFFRRQLTPVVTIPPTSDFFNKALWHELWHVHQFDNLPPWKDMWDVDDFYLDVLCNLPGQATESDMRDIILAEVVEWHAWNFTWYHLHGCEMEIQALEAEYAIEPRYLEIHRSEVGIQYWSHFNCP